LADSEESARRIIETKGIIQFQNFQNLRNGGQYLCEFIELGNGGYGTPFSQIEMTDKFEYSIPSQRQMIHGNWTDFVRNSVVETYDASKPFVVMSYLG
jgi:hypothetical protein